jgi:hypothetical protein
MLLEMLVGLIARILFALIEPVLHRCGFNNLPLQAFSWEKVRNLATLRLKQNNDQVTGPACGASGMA